MKHIINYSVFSSTFLLFLSLLIMLRQLGSSNYYSIFSEDTWTYTSWAWQFTEALKEGVIYPRWTPLNFWGYGSPTFIFYPPLAFYFIAVLNLFTNSVIVSMNIAKFISLFFSALGTFYLVREFYTEKIALSTASLYILFPKTVSDLYLSGAIVSVISFVWFPFILLFIYRYIELGRFQYLIYSGVCYGGLISTHFINAYMFLFVTVVFILYMAIVRKNITILKTIPLILIVAFSVSSAYILPLVFERTFINLHALISTGTGFRYSDFFFLPSKIHTLPDNNFWSVYYQTFMVYILLCFLLILLYIALMVRTRKVVSFKLTNTINLYFLIIAGFSIFLLFGPSRFIWENVPFFPYMEFPARWLNITSFAIIFLSALGFMSLETIESSKKRYVVIALLFSICLLFDFRYIITPAPVFTEKELLPVKSVTWIDGHLPTGVDKREINDEGHKQAIIVGGSRGITQILHWKSAERIIAVTAEEPLILRIRTFNFPGWTAFLNGIPLNVRTEALSGALLIDIPQGKHTLRLQFKDTPVRNFSKIISSLALLLIVFYLLSSR